MTCARARSPTAASASATFASRPGLAPAGEGAAARGGRQRAAVHALHQALRRELAQVAADGVLGDAELRHQPRRDDLAVARERVEDRLAALDAEEPVACTVLHGHAWYCMFVRV